MLIDWFTVAAQAVNFLVLIWLLHRFLYKPVLKAVDAREEKIKNELEEAEKKKSEAEKERKGFEENNTAFEQQRKSLLDNAAHEAETLRTALVEAARKEVAEQRTRLETALKEEQKSLNREILDRTSREVIAICRKVLADLASAELEGQIAEAFIERLKDLDEKGRRELAKALEETGGEVQIQSAFDLPESLEKKVNSMLKEVTGKDVSCTFQTAPEKISGIELKISGYKLSWSISQYLGSLEKKLLELLDTEIEKKEKDTPQ